MEVNLLTNKLKKVRDRQRIKKTAGKILLASITVIAFLMIGLSSYSLGIANSNKKLEQKISVTKVKITQLEEVESKQLYLISKLTAFADLLKLQERHQGVAETIFGLIPNGTSLQGFEVNEDGNITLAGKAPNWLKLYELLSLIKESKSGQFRVVQAQVNKVNFGSKGEINFNINILLSKAN